MTIDDAIRQLTELRGLYGNMLVKIRVGAYGEKDGEKDDEVDHPMERYDNATSIARGWDVDGVRIVVID